MTYFELKDKSDQYFRKIVGINKLVFNEILNILLEHQKLKTTIGGRPYKMSIEDRLVMSLRYLYENRTYHSIGAEYGMVDTTALRNIRSIEDILIKNNKFNNLTNKNIFSDIGKNHDFKTFKNSKLKFLPETIILADKGYQGLQKIHANTFLPIKISKNNPKTNKTKIFNKIINKTRRKIEHVFAFLKCFKIIGYKFRKARKRIFLRFNLIAGFYNLSLKLKNVMQ